MPGEITIYTDGAASGNPGPGGYGVVLISGKHRLEKSEGFRLTTNNRMELLAVITALEALKIQGSRAVVYTDSKYVADAVEKGWVFQWESKAFRKKKNPDLWIRFLKVYRRHNVRFVWIKGHSNNTENEVCDRLAVKAYSNASLLEDTGYKSESEENKLL
ncbi:MAG: ribonuclease HI [Bacteroidetes bacterium GWE2_41_25]|nr:MAG: ribonuclease HI [Bacteroidetes bacterium GWA2_40_15]OFX83532.1 MAG: ribonuclease HI [Bacteroidetes bacterium GWC2_40_22]OFX95459.1 MAG: ribonuclease HI [Bacteroidetes bacterium GWE2_41_25]OFY59250.1 MAG: ribonuclease HI [Bacteroidetes bacterium GWF2_41_9]HAM09983.1 ribonuclease HI [Bacteroidales bacterium]